MKTKRFTILQMMFLVVFSTLAMLSTPTIMAQNNKPFSKASKAGGSRDDNYITVTNPNGGEQWRKAESYNITWDKDLPNGHTVDIYLFKGGYQNSVITTQKSGTSYIWFIPMSVTIDTDYWIRVQDHDDYTIDDFSDAEFSILEPYVINVTSPDGGESWLPGSTHNITWTDNIPVNVKIELFKNDSFNSTIASSTPSDGSFSWTIPGSQTFGDDYKVKITSTSNSYLYSYSNEDFTITGPPFITVVSPSNVGVEYDWDEQIEIYWNDNISENVKIELYKGGILNQTIVSSTQSDGYYVWDIPDDIVGGNDFKVKITSISTGTVYDFSNNNFTINAKTITVTTPNGGESWQAGAIHNIFWSANFPDSIKIELYKNGVYNSTIASSTTGNGHYQWLIPSTQTGGDDYKVKVSSTTQPSVYDYSDNTFTIGGAIMVTSPNGGESWVKGSTHNITWTGSSGSFNVKIDLIHDGYYYSTIASSTPNNGGYAWTISTGAGVAVGDQYKIRITTLDETILDDESDDNFSITDSLTVTSPNGGEDWVISTEQTITWIGAPGATDVKIELYLKGLFTSTITSSTPNDGSFAWGLGSSLIADEYYKVKITTLGKDPQEDFSDNNFTISENYHIHVLSPNGGEVWQAGSTHAITWSDNLPDDVKIKLFKGASVDSDIVYSTPSNGNYSWTIPANQDLGTDYRVRISGNTNFVLDYSDSYFTISAAGPPAYDTVQNVTVTNNQTQCFNATNTILVAGSGTTVDINSGGEANFIAGQKVLFKPGFHAYSGSNAHAQITLTADYCSNQQSMIGNPDDIYELEEINFDKESAINIYPNPTTGRFTIDFMGEATTAEILLFNLQGNMLYKSNCTEQLSWEMDISHLQMGMYIVVIKTLNNVITRKVIKNY